MKRDIRTRDLLYKGLITRVFSTGPLFGKKWAARMFCAGMVVTAFLLFFGPREVYAARHKILVYCFKNVSGEERYDELAYALPKCIYSEMKKRLPDGDISVIDTGKLKPYLDGKNRNLFESEVILEIAERRGIDEVVFGQFYVEYGKPVLIGKVYYIESGLILDIRESNEDYYGALGDVEALSVDQVSACEIEKAGRVYRPDFKTAVKTGEPLTVRHNLSLDLGIVIPLSEWSDLFTYGVSGVYFYTLFPKEDTFPLGFGFQTGFSYFSRDADEYYKESELFLFPVGVMVRYKAEFKGFLEGIAADIGVGGCFSRLFVGNTLTTSTDPYIRTALHVMLAPLKDHHFSLTFSYTGVGYKDTPMDLLGAEAGVVFYF
ncbi:MAG: hypothetical protein JXQ30_01895 [Spirochaetes bacterium]|nr:hypothetical protein [Spirochaetota bacterium]